MATKRMLVDAIHPEETRIVVTNGNRLEEFDFESASRRQLRGNIYLAKVTRVEPSLQAAFIEYGGNRHGFLAFSEIHPDYYQIPVADREALLREEADDADDDEHEADHAAASAPAESVSSHADDGVDAGADHVDSPEAPSEANASDDPQSTVSDDADEAAPLKGHVEEAPQSNEPVESVGGGDDLEDVQEQRRRPMNLRRQYKIQEVIKRRQVMLVQVVKEERGNKGAALTTYLSLAGRYSVLMPNTARGGGISRKITNAADRKRLKEIVGDLDVPTGQGIILRTAGASRTKAEVKRDFEYLQRLWENVRTLTLKSTAPCLVYEEGSLIKRTIRDLYSREIDELLVAGDDAYREAKDFMKMIMPSHAKNVQLYKDDQPLFGKFNVEGQLDQMFSPQVTLPSGGYLVINPTEALVSIDVNSGRSTKEHNIEDTALQTNLEAAEEVSRQLRLRDLAGLIVIDFIDMMENRSNRAVERKLKDALKNDRARIQVGRISHFGLMEMSRQRIRFGVVESSTHKCPACNGTGLVRSVESLALMVMRAVEEHVLKKPGQSINLRVPTDVALYILNSKRGTLNGLEQKYALSITVMADDHVGTSHFAIERGEDRVLDRSESAGPHVRVDTATLPEPEEEPEVADEAEEDDVEAAATEDRAESDSGDRNGRRRRRRRRGERDDRPQPQQQRVEAVAETAVAADAEGSDEDDEAEDGEQQEAGANGHANGNGEEPRRRRRRGRRGGRRNRREGESGPGEASQDGAGVDVIAAPVGGEAQLSDAAAERIGDAILGQDAIAEQSGLAPQIEALAEPAAPAAAEVKEPEAAEVKEPEVAAKEERPARPRGRRRAAAAPPTEEQALAAAEAVAVAAPEPAIPEPKIAEPEDAAPAVEPEPASEPADDAGAKRRGRKAIPEGEILVSSTAEAAADEKPRRAGWWQRRLGLGS